MEKVPENTLCSLTSINAFRLVQFSKMKNPLLCFKSIKNILVPVSLKKTKLSEKDHFISKTVSFRENAELRCEVESGNPLPIIVWRYKPLICSDESCDGPGDGWTRQFRRVSILVFHVLSERKRSKQLTDLYTQMQIKIGQSEKR